MALSRPEVQISLLIGLALLFTGARAVRFGSVNNRVKVFDVTKFGAKPGGKVDCGLAFTRAWVAACRAGGPAKVVIPPGNYKAGEVLWTGPCRGHVTVEVQGIITAKKDISEFPNGMWFLVENVDGFAINGANFKGSFHGSGASSWKYHTCTKSPEQCGYAPAPPTFMFNNVKHGDVGYLTSVDSRGYHFKIVGSSDVKLHNLNIKAPSTSPNTNALNTVSSRNVGIVDSVINTGGGKNCVVWGPGTVSPIFNKVACNLARH